MLTSIPSKLVDIISLDRSVLIIPIVQECYIFTLYIYKYGLLCEKYKIESNSNSSNIIHTHIHIHIHKMLSSVNCL